MEGCSEMNVRKSRFVVCAALSLILIITAGTAEAGLFGLFGRKKKPAPKEPPRTLVVFPFDQAAESKSPDGFGSDVAAGLRAMLGQAEDYTVFLYTERLAPIRRAREDSSLKAKDEWTPPFADASAEGRTKTLKLAQILGTDLFLVGSVEDYTVDMRTKTAQMTISAELFNGRTGKLVKTYLITGRSPETAKAGEEEELRALAAGDAVAKLKSELTSPTTDTPADAAGAASVSTRVVVPSAETKGQVVSVTVEFTNSGEQEAKNASVVAAVPPGLEYIAGSAEATGGAWNAQTRTIAWVIDSIPAGQVAKRTFQAKVN